MFVKLHFNLIAVAICGVLFVGTLTSAATERSTYSGGQLDIKEATLTDSGEVQITFNTMPETLYYCPGANGETTEEGTLLTFVRSFVKVKPKVDYPARHKGDPAKTWDRLILVEAKDKPIYVKSGKELVKIYSAERPQAEDKRGNSADAKQLKQTTETIEVFVDLSLGLCDEQAAKRRFESLKAKNPKVALKQEIEGMKGDLVGIRRVTGEEFVALISKMEIVSSGQSIAPIGLSRDRAYLEVNVFLTSKHRYVAVVTTELAGLPKEAVMKIKQ